MKKLWGLLVLVGTLVLFSDIAMNQPLKVMENLRHEQVLLPPSVPDKSRMAVRDSVIFIEAGGGAGILVFYDDTRTKCEVDYIELYDLEGNLLVVSWIDRTGIRQVAMDRGLLDPKNPLVDRVLVMIAVGTPV